MHGISKTFSFNPCIFQFNKLDQKMHKKNGCGGAYPQPQQGGQPGKNSRDTISTNKLGMWSQEVELGEWRMETNWAKA
jgi:hypothetical protein